MSNLKQGFVHTVFFWLSEPNNRNSHQKLKEGLHNLSKISVIKTAYIGTPAPTNREVIDNTYDFSITFVFENASDQDIYQDHPNHHKFITECGHLWKKVQVYDAL